MTSASMSLNKDDKDPQSIGLLFDEKGGEKSSDSSSHDPEDMPYVLDLPSFEDDDLREEIEYGRMTLQQQGDEVEMMKEMEKMKGMSEYHKKIEDEKKARDKLLYYDNRRTKRLKSQKVPPFRPWTEKELRSVPLIEVERQKAPLFHYFTMFWDGMLYPTYSIWYSTRYLLVRYVIVDFIMLCLAFTALVGLIYLICWWIVTQLLHMEFSSQDGQTMIIILFELFLYLILLTSDSGINWLAWWLNRTKYKVSSVVEHIMKGSKAKNYFCYSRTKGERGGNFLVYLFGIVIDKLTVIGIKFVIFTLVVPFIVSIFMEIGTPAIGYSLNFVVTFLLITFDYSLSSFSITLNRKKFRYRERFMFCLRYFPLMIGYGFSVLIINFIPFVNIYYLLCCDYVAGTRAFLHLEYRRGPHKDYWEVVPRIVYQTTVFPDHFSKPVVIQQAGDDAKNIIINEDVFKIKQQQQQQQSNIQKIEKEFPRFRDDDDEYEEVQEQQQQQQQQEEKKDLSDFIEEDEEINIDRQQQQQEEEKERLLKQDALGKIVSDYQSDDIL